MDKSLLYFTMFFLLCGAVFGGGVYITGSPSILNNSNVTTVNVSADKIVAYTSVCLISGTCLGTIPSWSFPSYFNQGVNTTSNVTFYNGSFSGNVSAQYFFGNGSQLRDVCLSNGSFCTTYTTFYPNSSAVTGGSYTDGTNINASFYYDKYSLNFSEGSGVDPLDIYINFTNVTGFTQVAIREYYLGSASHNVQFQLWNYVSSSWENYYNIVGQSGFNTLSLPVFDNQEHIGTIGVNYSIVQFRLHHVENGISSHRMYIDFVWLLNGNSIGSSTNLDGYAKYQFMSNSFNGSGDFTTIGNINASYSNTTLRNLTINNNLRVNGTFFKVQTINVSSVGGNINPTSINLNVLGSCDSMNCTSLSNLITGTLAYKSTAGGTLIPTGKLLSLTYDASNVSTVATSMVTFEHTNFKNGDSWADGFLSVDSYGSTGTTIAAYTRAKVNGTGEGIGYRGYCANTAGVLTGSCTGVDGYVFLSGGTTASAGVAVSGTVLLFGANNKSRVFAFKTESGNSYFGGGSVMIGNGIYNAYLSSHNYGTLVMSNTTGSLYVQNYSEFDSTVYFDGGFNALNATIDRNLTIGNLTINQNLTVGTNPGLTRVVTINASCVMTFTQGILTGNTCT